MSQVSLFYDSGKVSSLKVVGLDIGGANIKISTADGISRSFAFPMWKQHQTLPDILKAVLVNEFEASDLIAVTMTAELADCFPSKASGVEFIIHSVTTACPGIAVRVWMTSGEFATAEEALDFPFLVAASNWNALATWAGRAAGRGPALLIDVGSTTTDLIPIFDGLPATEGTTDFTRLQHNELLYTGVLRTPVCAMLQSCLIDGVNTPVAAELFATAMDVHIVLGNIPEQPELTDTADGRPATREASLNRLAHMLCGDIEELAESQIVQLAETAAESQRNQILNAARNRVAHLKTLSGTIDSPSSAPMLLLSGSGSWLAESVIAKIPELRHASVIKLGEAFHRPIHSEACAFAVARLAAERCIDDLLPQM
ncbi:MAG: hypothetical protein JNL58_08260 [Planctomyces sp.]|nr:hypothetical protein [Planctomyces sp.]